ncbi:hypothetical protein H8356DRAFT_1308431 [Neocallimastix lanati (nom. inval.)]|nr:hypothetical protein H8356DRAFT_1308431 [Neocallimastix sp. JGI-2020a]
MENNIVNTENDIRPNINGSKKDNINESDSTSPIIENNISETENNNTPPITENNINETENNNTLPIAENEINETGNNNTQPITENDKNEFITENNERELLSENINEDQVIKGKKVEFKDIPMNDVNIDDNENVIINADDERNDDISMHKLSSSSSKSQQENLMESLPNQIINKEDLSTEESLTKNNSTEFNFCEMFDNTEKELMENKSRELEHDIDNLNHLNDIDAINNLNRPNNLNTFNNININKNAFLSLNNNNNNNNYLDKQYNNIPVRFNKIVNIEDNNEVNHSLIRLFHKSESIAESINSIENKEKLKSKNNRSRQTSLLNMRRSTFISDAHYNKRHIKDLFNEDDSIKEETNSIDEEGRQPTSTNANRPTFTRQQTKYQRKMKRNDSFSSSLDILLYKSHENMGYIDQIMLQKMNNTSKSRNVIRTVESEKQQNEDFERRYYYPIEFTDNVEGRKLYYEYKVRKSMTEEPLIIHRRNLLFIICFLLTLFLLALLIYDYHSLLINEKNSIFYTWINAIYILHIVDISLALLAYIYSNESTKRLFTIFTLILGLFTIILFICRFIFTWATKNLIPIDYK